MEENQIVNQNAEGQESVQAADATGTSTATTNQPAQTEQPAVAQGIAQKPVAETVAAHDDFDWSIDKRNVSSYTKEEKEKYETRNPHSHSSLAYRRPPRRHGLHGAVQQGFRAQERRQVHPAHRRHRPGAL